MIIEPSAALLAACGVEVVEALGGQRNRHWLVTAHGERLILRRWAGSTDDVAYELRLLERVAALGWPVATALGEPLVADGARWSIFPHLPGEPQGNPPSLAEQTERGRLLAHLHANLIGLTDIGQRGDWRRCEIILADPGLDRILTACEGEQAEEVRLLRWHLAHARERIGALRPHTLADTIVHGDFTSWNLRFQGGRLTGILDFELAHRDHRIADFVLSWRGHYDAVIHSYDAVSPLAPEEWALLTPLWWAFLIEGACKDLAAGVRDDGWTAKHLRRRSPLMGRDTPKYPY